MSCINKRGKKEVANWLALKYIEIINMMIQNECLQVACALNRILGVYICVYHGLLQPVTAI